MGGIAGIFERREKRVSEKLLTRQADLLDHRGSYARQTMLQPSTGLLRLVPERHRSTAPALELEHNQRYHIAAAGSLFNLPEIRQRCPDRRVDSTASALLVLFEGEGVDGFRHCNGQFSCAIWDSLDQTITLVVDQFGFQPLYYWITASRLVFASEAKAIRCHPDFSANPDDKALAEFLCCERYFLQSDRSFFKDINRLLPGTALTVSANDHRIERYWKLEPIAEPVFASDETCIESVRDIMLDAVRIRLPENNQVAAALSGGFDSSSIVCMIRHLLDRAPNGEGRIDSYSYDFGSDQADETELVKLVSERCNSQHHHINVLNDQFFDDIDQMLDINDGPVLESGVLLLLKKKRKASQMGNDVLLSGLGGDELFMGRLNYFADLLRQGQFGELFHQIRGVYPWDQSTGKRSSLKKIIKAYLYAPLEPYALKKWRKQGSFPPNWLTQSLAERTGLTGTYPRGSERRFDRVYDQDCHDVFYYELMGGALGYHDIASSAFGMETRFPLLDIRLVETMFSLPRRWKIERGRVRHMQKSAMKPFLPAEIISDHLKKDFHPVLDDFLKNQYRRHLEPMLDSTNRLSDDYVNWNEIRKYFERYCAGEVKPYPLWCAINIEKWLRNTF